jgi:hypothetical protein
MKLEMLGQLICWKSRRERKKSKEDGRNGSGMDKAMNL